ncbi:MAG TPA: hotdog fold thioesterase [Polyangiaceae bacterium]|nr:hotdog fold thioesterase [Polyangiaceae bacterium]
MTHEGGNADAVRAWIRESPFTRDLGVTLEELDGSSARLSLPYEEHLRAFGSLHGGVVASLASISSHAILRAEASPDDTPPRTLSLHVLYARAARGPSFTTETRLVRRARELGFFETRITDASGEAIASATATLATDAAPPSPPGLVERGGRPLGGEQRWGRDPASRPPPPNANAAFFDAAIATLPFLARRSLRIAALARGQLDMIMAPIEENLDRDGTIHEGAALTLIDAAGANGPWTIVAPSEGAGGATIALHAQILCRLPARGLLAHARVRAYDARVHTCDVQIFDAENRQLHALGTVIYRMTAKAPR